MIEKTDKTFINRWSRAKLANRDPLDEPEQIHEAAEQSAMLPETTDEATETLEEQIPPDLPSIDSLDGDSDYTPFLGENVPEELARKALRKLWSSDPVFANMDGLNDYDEDYSSLGIIKTVVETAYKVGKGIVDEEKPEIPKNEEDQGDEESVAEVEAPDNESEPPPDEESVQLADDFEHPIPHGEKH
ncbi:MAG: DUF3306 domain-containing protein [Rhodospirillales bacterium]|nr:DUF3306 domain-containing protein [Rhodospirillales bacterium]